MLSQNYCLTNFYALIDAGEIDTLLERNKNIFEQKLFKVTKPAATKREREPVDSDGDEEPEKKIAKIQ